MVEIKRNLQIIGLFFLLIHEKEEAGIFLPPFQPELFACQ